MSSTEAGLFHFLIFFLLCGYLNLFFFFFSALKYLIPVTSKHAIQKSGLTPIHSAADGQNAQCLELLIENGFDVNSLLSDHISESYDDERKTALYFAVCNNDILCTEILLAAGADPNLDPLNCLLVAVRASNHEIVRLLLAHGANVNCYFMHVNDTRFPSAIQYALNDEVMLRLLLNNGYQVEMCFECMHGDIFGNSFVWSEIEEEVLPGWTSCVIKDNPVSYTLLFVLGQHHNIAHLGMFQEKKNQLQLLYFSSSCVFVCNEMGK